MPTPVPDIAPLLAPPSARPRAGSQLQRVKKNKRLRARLTSHLLITPCRGVQAGYVAIGAFTSATLSSLGLANGIKPCKAGTFAPMYESHFVHRERSSSATVCRAP